MNTQTNIEQINAERIRTINISRNSGVKLSKTRKWGPGSVVIPVTGFMEPRQLCLVTKKDLFVNGNLTECIVVVKLNDVLESNIDIEDPDSATNE